MDNTSGAKLAIVVKFRTRLSTDELRKRYLERLPKFRDVQGLLQKFYIYDESSKEWGGIYVWDSEQSAQAYLESDLRKTITTAFEVEGTPRVERLEVVDVLR